MTTKVKRSAFDAAVRTIERRSAATGTSVKAAEATELMSLLGIEVEEEPPERPLRVSESGRGALIIVDRDSHPLLSESALQALVDAYNAKREKVAAIVINIDDSFGVNCRPPLESEPAAWISSATALAYWLRRNAKALGIEIVEES